MTQVSTKQNRRRKPRAQKVMVKQSAAKWRSTVVADERQWRVEVRYFESMRRKLWNLPEYREKYVAIRKKKIIDVDVDHFELVRRTIAQFPNEVVLVVKVELEPRRIVLPDMRVR